MKSPERSSPPSNFEYSTLPASFYLRDTLEVARELIGKGLVLERCLVELVEVEAYLGLEDPASHAYRGPSRRNQSMFAAGGCSYVYLSYGINFCMNVVTREAGIGQAVLLRAAAPISGMECLLKNRTVKKPEFNLLNGPGKLTQALGIDLSHDGLRLDLPHFKIVDLGIQYDKQSIGASPRIGISKARTNPWRFYLKNSPWLSRRG